MAKGYWDLQHVDVEDQFQHQVPDQYEPVRQYAKDTGAEPFEVIQVFGPEGPGGTTKPMMRFWFKRWVES